MKQLVECRSRTADKLVVLAECKPKPADESRVADKIFWELSVAAIDCSAKDSGSDFLLWHSPQELADGSRAADKVFWELSLQQLTALLKIPALIFYCGIAHEFEYLSNQ